MSRADYHPLAGFRLMISHAKYAAAMTMGRSRIARKLRAAPHDSLGGPWLQDLSVALGRGIRRGGRSLP